MVAEQGVPGCSGGSGALDSDLSALDHGHSPNFFPRRIFMVLREDLLEDQNGSLSNLKQEKCPAEQPMAPQPEAHKLPAPSSPTPDICPPHS